MSDTNIQYIANQVKVLFFRLGFYEDWVGKLHCMRLHERITLMQKKMKNGKTIPRTWIVELRDAQPIVEASRELGGIDPSWYKNYFLLLKYFGEDVQPMENLHAA